MRKTDKPSLLTDTMYTTSAFDASLVNAIIGHMTANNVKVLPMSFLAFEQNVGEVSKVAETFYNKGHWEYFFVKDGKLCCHVNYRGEYGLGEYDYEVCADHQPMYDEKGTAFDRLFHILAADLVQLVRVCYETIGNVHFNPSDDDITVDDVEAWEQEYEDRRNEVA